jgi:peptidoglycan/xylan/chitin deacetylase (PgdA/CDA1 family)
MNTAARRIITHPAVLRTALSLVRDVAPIFMCHRFRDDELGNFGHDPEALRANLAWLRANKCSLLSLPELLDRLAEGAPLNRAVAFTVDDGYGDFARVAAPLFAEFDCPVTVFLTTGFLDGKQWMWWDKLSVALSALGREAEFAGLVRPMKHVPEHEKHEQIAELLKDLHAPLSAAPPPRFAPISWDDVRRLSRSGVTFGPHSVTHPVLARTGTEQAQYEIAESWRRVREEAGDGAVPIFCFPNGGEDDFGVREEDAVKASGMVAAVSAQPGYASRHDLSTKRRGARFRLPRFAYSENHSTFVQVASGIERVKSAVRLAFGLNSH